MKEHIEDVADILMAAAHADGRLEGSEKDAVKDLLARLIGAATLPIDLDFRLSEFAIGSFDLGESGAKLAKLPDADKRKVLELCAAVHGADQEFDMAEDDFIRALGGAMGLDDQHFRDLVSEIEEEIHVR